jgi:hypothetical protein
MWSVNSKKAKEHDGEVVPQLLEHIKTVHPRVLSARFWRTGFDRKKGGPNRMLMMEYKSFKSMGESDSREKTPECDTVWTWTKRLMVRNSFQVSIWQDISRDKWKETPRRAVPVGTLHAFNPDSRGWI